MSLSSAAKLTADQKGVLPTKKLIKNIHSVMGILVNTRQILNTKRRNYICSKYSKQIMEKMQKFVFLKLKGKFI